MSFLKCAPLFYCKYLKSPSLPQPLIMLETFPWTFSGTMYFILLKIAPSANIHTME